MYFNGEYQGVVNIREDDDSDFAENNYPKKDVIEYGEGELFDIMYWADMTNEVTRNEVSEIINMRDYYFYFFHNNFLRGDEVAEVGYQVVGEKVDTGQVS